MYFTVNEIYLNFLKTCSKLDLACGANFLFFVQKKRGGGKEQVHEKDQQNVNNCWTGWCRGALHCFFLLLWSVYTSVFPQFKERWYGLHPELDIRITEEGVWTSAVWQVSRDIFETSQLLVCKSIGGNHCSIHICADNWIILEVRREESNS